MEKLDTSKTLKGKRLGSPGAVDSQGRSQRAIVLNLLAWELFSARLQKDLEQGINTEDKDDEEKGGEEEGEEDGEDDQGSEGGAGGATPAQRSKQSSNKRRRSGGSSATSASDSRPSAGSSKYSALLEQGDATIALHRKAIADQQAARQEQAKEREKAAAAQALRDEREEKHRRETLAEQTRHNQAIESLLKAVLESK